MWLNALAWTTYGLIIRGDINIFVPNLVGFVVATMQLHLFVVYGITLRAPPGCASLLCAGEEAASKGKNHDDQV
jgi:hypothetical protein